MSSFKTGTFQVVIKYKENTHHIKFSGRTFARIQKCGKVRIFGQGFFNGEKYEKDEWEFNFKRPGSLYVLTEKGRVIYDGNIRDEAILFMDEVIST
jgi:hypothetical protein